MEDINIIEYTNFETLTQENFININKNINFIFRVSIPKIFTYNNNEINKRLLYIELVKKLKSLYFV